MLSTMNNPYNEKVAACYNQPRRVDFPRVSQIIDGEFDPVRAWQKLIEAGLIPNDGHRRFVEPSDGDELWPSDRLPESNTPTSFQGVLTFASDFGGRSKAEEHAWEFAKRLEPWGAICDGQVVWYFTNAAYEVTYFKKPYNSARDSVSLSLPKIGIEMETLMTSEESLPNLVRRALAAWEGWELAVQHDLALEEPKWIDLRKWPRFSDLPNPFEPLLELWCTGYRIVSAFDNDDPTIRLYTKYIEANAIAE